MTDKHIIVRRSIVIPPSGLMSIKQAADYIGCSVSYLEKNPDRPKEIRLGKKKSFHVDDVNEWLDKRRAA
jgi:hypothetical protein